MFRVEFATDNAAFGDNEAQGEIALVLRVIARKVADEGELSGNIRDSNGNTIGKYEYVPED